MSKYLLTASQAKHADRRTSEVIGLPGAVLMERAALGIKEEILNRIYPEDHVLLICGSGNNGGDGFAAARLLMKEGCHADVLFVGKPEKCSDLCAMQKRVYENLGGRVFTPEERAGQSDAANLLGQYDLLVDALFGIGLTRPLEGSISELVQTMNDSGVPILAVDIPSGVNASDGRVMEQASMTSADTAAAVKAQVTVTFDFYKLGQFVYPGCEYCGEVICKNAGIEPAPDWAEAPAFFLEDEDIQKLLPKRKARSNKGTYGKALIIAGCEAMPGAAMLCSESAYRTGCGLVKLITDEKQIGVCSTRLPEAIYGTRGTDKELEEAVNWAGAVAIGPGLGKDKWAVNAVNVLLHTGAQEHSDEAMSDSKKPKPGLVLDADALNILAEQLKAEDPCLKLGKQMVLTPHPGEMSRLTGKSVKEILADPAGVAKTFAKERECIVLLKDARTVITDGVRVCINTTGCSGMATGGSGDVLTGMIVSLMAQGLPPFEAACLGAYLHGKAGEAAAAEKGDAGMLAGDLISVGIAGLWDASAEGAFS